MSLELAYCSRPDETQARLRALYEERDQSIVLATMAPSSPARAAYARTREAGFCDYPDPGERARYWDSVLKERAAVLDDSVPSAYPTELDQGLYGGLLGGDVLFLFDPASGWLSSMVHPLLDDWDGLDDLSYSTRGEWFKRYVNQLGVFGETARGKFGISHFILINGLNFVFELVGATKTYEALIERPEWAHRAIEMGHDLNAMVQRAFFAHAPLVDGGTCSAMAQWMPGRILAESVDPFHMASVAYFEEWGRGTLERMFAEFDGGVTHIHGNGRHLLEAVSSVKGLKAMSVADDKGFPRAFDVLGEIKQRTGDMPLIVGVPFDDFSKALKENSLIGGVLYSVSSVPDADTANRCMDAVRAYRA